MQASSILLNLVYTSVLLRLLFFIEISRIDFNKKIEEIIPQCWGIQKKGLLKKIEN